jgi:hypothetical protein
MDAYLGWRDECKAVWDAYGSWTDAGEAEAAFAFRTYAAALDREERASELYAGLIRHAGELLVPERELRAGLATSQQGRR